MSFRGHIRPGQGFKPFTVLRREAAETAAGRPYTGELTAVSAFLGIISQASPHEIEQSKQLGSPISHTVLQRGREGCGRANDVLELTESGMKRQFLVQGAPHDPGELGHFLVYRVLERVDF